MSTPPMSRSDRKALATRDLIVSVACELVGADGPAALTLPAVSARADVAVQTIYNRVGGRDAVLLAVVERAMEVNRHYMDAAYETHGTPIARISAAAAAYARFALENPHEFRLLGTLDLGGDSAARVATLIEEQNGKLAAAIADGVGAGSLRAGVDPATAATVLWAALDGVLRLSLRADAHHADPHVVLPLFESILTHGLATRPSLD